jgi:hypothetical protein
MRVISIDTVKFKNCYLFLKPEVLGFYRNTELESSVVFLIQDISKKYFQASFVSQGQINAD